MMFNQTQSIPKSYWFFIFLCLLAVVVVIVVSAPSKLFIDNQNGGLRLFRDDQEAGALFDMVGYYHRGQLPYQDTHLGYPPLAILYLTIPALFTDQLGVYSTLLIILNAIVTLAVIAVTFYLTKDFGGQNRRLWLFALPAFLYFAVNRFDVLPVFLSMLSLLLLIKKKWCWSFFLLSLLFLTKGYALVLFPIWFVFYLNQQEKGSSTKTVSRPLLFFLAPILLITGLVCLVAGLENGLFPYAYQSLRFFGYGSFLVIFYQSLSGLLPEGIFNTGASLAVKIFSLLQLLLPILIFAGYGVFKKYIKTPIDVVRWSGLALLVYVFWGVYYSPQWLIWSLPFFVLIVGSWRQALWWVAYDIFSYLQFPVAWDLLSPYAPGFEIVVLGRTLILAVIIYMIGEKIWRENFRRKASLTRPAV
jgi:hypothetical protein